MYSQLSLKGMFVKIFIPFIMRNPYYVWLCWLHQNLYVPNGMDSSSSFSFVFPRSEEKKFDIWCQKKALMRVFGEASRMVSFINICFLAASLSRARFMLVFRHSWPPFVSALLMIWFFIALSIFNVLTVHESALPLFIQMVQSQRRIVMLNCAILTTWDGWMDDEKAKREEKEKNSFRSESVHGFGLTREPTSCQITHNRF